MNGSNVSYIFKNVGSLQRKARLGFHDSPVHAIQFSPDGMFMASGDDEGTLVVRAFPYV